GVVKGLAALQDLVPAAARVGFLGNRADPRFVSQTKDIQDAAKAAGLQIQVFGASTDEGLDRAFADLGQVRVGALMVGTSVYFNSRREKIVGLAARQGVPAIYQYREFADAGGLISYGPSITDA